MLHLNRPSNTEGSVADTDSSASAYKLLVLDRFCLDLLSPLIHVNDIRKHGITLYHLIDRDRQRVPDVPVIYFVRPTPNNITRIISDVSQGIYDSFHLNFSSSVPRSLLEDLATGTLQSDSVHRISKVMDQYLEFVTLEDNLFSLSQSDTYVELNDPKAGDREIEEIVDKIASGLFSVLATLGVVPVIRCASGGPAEMVANVLDGKIRDNLVTKSNIFTEAAGGGLLMGTTSFQRPVLCLFDRNFELAVGVQHDWSYRSLVHDVLELKLNKIQKQSSVYKYELGNSDSFWVSNSWSPFPKVAEEIELQLSKYKQDVDEVNRKTGGKDADAEFDGTDLIGNTKHLMSAVNSLPELRDRKNLIDKHTNIATVLLGEIKERSLDSYCTLEDDMLTKGSVDKPALLNLLKGKGTEEDKIRLAITYLLTSDATSQSELEPIEVALRESDVDTCAFQYVKKIKSLNASLASSTLVSGKSNLVDWAGLLYGQSISVVTAGMKNLLSGGRELAVTRIVEALMEGKPNPEVDDYLTFDPRAPRSGSGSASYLKGPFKEGIVFMIGGGNYVEYMSLMGLAQRSSQPAKHVIYGTTEVLTGVEFIEQLKVLGQKMGLGSSVVVTPPQ